METITLDEFAPITLNGEPLPTWKTRQHVYVEVGERLYAVEDVESRDCLCRRCLLHDDFGGCIPAEAMWGLVILLAGIA